MSLLDDEREAEERAKALHNERVKITANWLNGSAIAAVAVGCFAPITAFISSQASAPLGPLNALVAGWLLLSVSLHFASRIALRRMK